MDFGRFSDLTMELRISDWGIGRPFLTASAFNVFMFSIVHFADEAISFPKAVLQRQV